MCYDGVSFILTPSSFAQARSLVKCVLGIRGSLCISSQSQRDSGRRYSDCYQVH